VNLSPDSVQENTLRGQYAGFASRLIAFVLDWVIIWLVILLLNTIVIIVLSFFNLSLEQILDLQDAQTTLQKLFSIVFLLLGVVINFVLFYAYFIFFWMLVGQTPGKMVMGVRIVSTNGRPISFFQSIRRLIGYWISMIVLFMGFLWVLISDTRQGWHDKIANTYVIYSWEAQGSFKFFNRLTHYADKRSQAYERKHPTLAAENVPDQPLENNQED
jgi:uncharacterized RDD family membrane protein YckC